MRKPLLTFERRDPGAKVLIVTNMWPNEDNPAYGIFVKRQIDSLVEAGLRCDVLFIRGYRSSLAYPLAVLRLLAMNARRHRYRLVHGHGGETALAVRAYIRAPVLVSYCGDDLLGTPRADGTLTWPSRVRRQILRAHSRILGASITKSRGMEATLPPSVAARNLVVPNGVDRGVFAPIPRDEARAHLGWPVDERVALFVGDPAVQRKRHWLAKAACERAGDLIGPVRLHVAADVGPGEVPTLMNAADCLLLTSSIEGSPNVVKEALMCNLPVVTTDVGDVTELLEGIMPSFVCEADPAALGEALAACLRDRRRSNGRDASEWLGSEAIAQRLLGLFERLSPGLRIHPADRSEAERCAA